MGAATAAAGISGAWFAARSILVSMRICSGATTSESTLCKSAAAPSRLTSKRTEPPVTLSITVFRTEPMSPRPCSIMSSSAGSIGSARGARQTWKLRVTRPACEPGASVEGSETRSSIIASTCELSGGALSRPRW